MEIGNKKLIPGDILLYSGNDTLSKFINCFDNSHYSHAAVYIGNGMIQESTRAGCLRKPMKLSFLTYEEILVKRIENRCELGKLKRVLKQAKKLEGKEYDFVQIVQLAHYGLSNCPPITRIDAFNVLEFLDMGINILASRILNTDDKLQCAEFAYRCYNDAVKNETEENDMYSLHLLHDNILEGQIKVFNSLSIECHTVSSENTVVIDVIDKISFKKLEKENTKKNSENEEKNMDDFFNKVESYKEEKLLKNNNKVLISQNQKENIEKKLFEFRILAGASLVNSSKLKNLKMTYEEKMMYLYNVFDRSKFVTAKDLNQAKNLVNVVKFRPDITRDIEELDVLGFNQNDYPNDKTPCKKEDIINK